MSVPMRDRLQSRRIRWWVLMFAAVLMPLGVGALIASAQEDEFGGGNDDSAVAPDPAPEPDDTTFPPGEDEKGPTDDPISPWDPAGEDDEVWILPVVRWEAGKGTPPPDQYVILPWDPDGDGDDDQWLLWHPRHGVVVLPIPEGEDGEAVILDAGQMRISKSYWNSVAVVVPMSVAGFEELLEALRGAPVPQTRQHRALKAIRRAHGAIILNGPLVRSLSGSALPAAAAHRLAMLGLARSTTRDLNGRLFRNMVGDMGHRGADAPTDRWRTFAAGEFANLELHGRRGESAAVDVWAASAGVETGFGSGLDGGLGVSLVRGDAELGDDIASLEANGGVVAPYLNWSDGSLWLNGLYGLGWTDNHIDRPAPDGVARGSTESWFHALEFHAGWRVPIGIVVVGPIAGAEFRWLTIDGYSEKGSAYAAQFGRQRVESALTRLGAQLAVPFQVGGWRLTPHARAAWEHEWADGDEWLFATSLTPAVAAKTGRRVETTPYEAAGPASLPERDYLSAGAALRLDTGGAWAVWLDYEGHFFRGDTTGHFVGLRGMLRW
ncbi:MAG: autotransporter outer membrane beta-barrel domain-containing protein [Kiritimatiellae bacterium]|nr:autotransporter outer membrane beta-barrel domain-containing protein [Kiritimatiellia bacterium]